MKSNILANSERSETGWPFFSNGVTLTAAVIRTLEPSLLRNIFKSFK